MGDQYSVVYLEAGELTDKFSNGRDRVSYERSDHIESITKAITGKDISTLFMHQYQRMFPCVEPGFYRHLMTYRGQWAHRIEYVGDENNGTLRLLQMFPSIEFNQWHGQKMMQPKRTRVPEKVDMRENGSEFTFRLPGDVGTFVSGNAFSKKESLEATCVGWITTSVMEPAYGFGDDFLDQLDQDHCFLSSVYRVKNGQVSEGHVAFIENLPGERYARKIANGMFAPSEVEPEMRDEWSNYVLAIAKEACFGQKAEHLVKSDIRKRAELILGIELLVALVVLAALETVSIVFKWSFAFKEVVVPVWALILGVAAMGVVAGAIMRYRHGPLFAEIDYAPKKYALSSEMQAAWFPKASAPGGEAEPYFQDAGELNASTRV